MVKPAPDRLYGRQRTHALRPRQRCLLDVTLPRLAAPADPVFRRPLWLEIGFGSGEHALAFIRAHPGIGLIACEVFEQGLCSLLSALVPEGGEAHAPLPDTLRVWPGDARTLLRALPPASLDGAILMFPDPWPKARHAKRRFVHPDTVALMARALRPGAAWRIASDDPTYQGWVRQVMAGAPAFRLESEMGVRPVGWAATRYEAKAARAGRAGVWWLYRRA